MRHRNQGRLGNGRTEGQAKSEQVQPQVGHPVACLTACQFVAAQEGRRSELTGHHTAYGKQRLLKSDQKQGQAYHHIGKTQQHLVRIGDRTLEDKKLEYSEHHRDGKDITQRTQQNRKHLIRVWHQTTIPYINTKLIGSKDAKAISPNPSSRGLLPFSDEARPTPRAVTSGTVMVEVVTPPES